LKVLTTIEEFRNSFVHFKWPSFPDFAAEDKAWRAINRVQEVIDALLAYEEQHVYYGQRERVAASAARTNQLIGDFARRWMLLKAMVERAGLRCAGDVGSSWRD
jgi:hypothetical protein